MPPAARITDLHVCPAHSYGGPSPVIGPGVPNVLIGGMPAAVMGDMSLCYGFIPDTVVKGSATVLIGGKPAARMGDSMAHGGMIIAGCPTVQIGG